MSASSTIEWTDATSDQAEHLKRADSEERLYADAFEPPIIEFLDPRQRVAVLLRAIARPTRGHDVAWTAPAAAHDGNHVVEGRGDGSAVRTALGEQFLAVLAGHRIHVASACCGSPASIDEATRGVPNAFTLSSVFAAEAALDGGERKPPSAVGAPRQTYGRHALTLGLRGGIDSATVHLATRGQSICARSVTAEDTARTPCLAGRAPLVSRGEAIAVLLDRDANASCRDCLDSTRAAHRSIVSGGCDTHG